MSSSRQSDNHGDIQGAVWLAEDSAADNLEYDLGAAAMQPFSPFSPFTGTAEYPAAYAYMAPGGNMIMESLVLGQANMPRGGLAPASSSAADLP